MAHKKYRIALIVFTAVIVLSVLTISVAAQASQNSEIVAEAETIRKEITEAQKRYEVMKKNLDKKNKELQSAKNSGKAKDSRIKRLESQIAQQNKKIAAQEKMIQELKSKLEPLPKPGSIPPQPAPSKGWHPKANCRLTAFTYKPGDPSVKLTIEFRNGEVEELEAPYDTNNGDKFFKIENLYANLQVVMPTSSRGDWTVNVDSRKDYVAKIDDPQNIESAKLDSNANKNKYGGKTFISGEAFIILTQSGMTIRPPYYTAPKK